MGFLVPKAVKQVLPLLGSGTRPNLAAMCARLVVSCPPKVIPDDFGGQPGAPRDMAVTGVMGIGLLGTQLLQRQRQQGAIA